MGSIRKTRKTSLLKTLSALWKSMVKHGFSFSNEIISMQKPRISLGKRKASKLRIYLCFSYKPHIKTGKTWVHFPPWNIKRTSILVKPRIQLGKRKLSKSRIYSWFPRKRRKKLWKHGVATLGCAFEDLRPGIRLGDLPRFDRTRPLFSWNWEDRLRNTQRSRPIAALK